MLPDTLVALSASALAQAIQLSIAPVFLLTAIGGFLSAITVRLGRVVDRARAIEASLPADAARSPDRELEPVARAARAELSALDRRMVLANRAVALSVASALTVCILITLLFVGSVTPLHPDRIIPVLFITALAFLIASLSAFALEISISIRTVRVRADLLRSES